MSSFTGASVSTASPSADYQTKSLHSIHQFKKQIPFRDLEAVAFDGFWVSSTEGLRSRQKFRALDFRLREKASYRGTVASTSGATSNKKDAVNGAANAWGGGSSRVGSNGSAGMNGESKYKMISIEEAIRKRASPQLKQSDARNSINGVRGGMIDSVNGIPSKAQNRALAQSAMDRKDNILAGKLVTRNDVGMKVEVPKAAKFLKLPAQAFAEGDVKVLPSDEGFSWSKENYSKLQRTIDVWSFVLSLRIQLYVIDAKWSYLGGFNEEKQKKRRRHVAAWVRESILQLGPTFIKLGQLSSTRSDLFPAEFVEELSKLQDRVPAFSPQKAKFFIQRELGEPVDALFKDFEELPIAAASLGQVHRALLPTGERVAIKVQRPGLKELFDIDLSNLKIIAEYFQNSETMGGPTRDWIGIYEECALILYQEIDYINEGRNADRFRRDFRNIQWVRVPTIYWDYTSRKVLTLEYVPGIKINQVELLDAGSFDRPKIAQRAIEAYLIQILKTGFFHADPHPGNLAVDVDGSLIYYDFGMMGEIKSFTREKLLEMFYSVYEKDSLKVIQALIELGALLPMGDMGSVRRSVQFFLDNLTNQKPDQATTFSAIGEDLFAIAVDQPFRFPATFTFVLRAFSTLEGIGYILDPNFSFAKVAAPYAQELLDVRNSRRNSQYFVQEVQRQATEARDAAVAMPSRIRRVDEFLRQLEIGDVKLRVRVLEAERAARKASLMQMATINTVAAATLLNIGVTLSTQGLSSFAVSSYIGAGIFSILVLNGMKRIRRLDKFETIIK